MLSFSQLKCVAMSTQLVLLQNPVCVNLVTALHIALGVGSFKYFFQNVLCLCVCACACVCSVCVCVWCISVHARTCVWYVCTHVCVCVHMCECICVCRMYVCVVLHMWRSEDSSWNLSLSFHHVSPRSSSLVALTYWAISMALKLVLLTKIKMSEALREKKIFFL